MVEARAQKAMRSKVQAPVAAPIAATKDDQVSREFGGTIGAALLMTVSHGLMLYLWMAWRFHDGAAFYPTGFADIGPFFASMWDQIVTYAAPSWSVFGIYWGFLLVEGLLAAYLPGIEIKGLPIPSRGGKRLVYRCNAISAWWITLAAVAVLHFTGVFPPSKRSSTSSAHS